MTVEAKVRITPRPINDDTLDDLEPDQWAKIMAKEVDIFLFAMPSAYFDTHGKKITRRNAMEILGEDTRDHKTVV